MHPFLVIGSCSSEGLNLLLLVIGITSAILVIGVFLAELAKDSGSPEKKFVRGLISTMPGW